MNQVELHSLAAAQLTTSSPRRARGAFINTAEASCSIFESGRMVFRCLRASPLYTLDYFSLDRLDLARFQRDGVLRQPGQPEPPPADAADDYDFYVFNWHFITMASQVDPEAVRRLRAPKFTVVLELAPGDPLQLVPPGVFDGFLALDPLTQDQDGIFAFPRPLEDDPWTGPPPRNEVPVIGSFGFGTPGKGFELLVEAVNREFDRALVRINVPQGDYVFTDSIHGGKRYAERLAEICREVAKPGIEVRFTSDYMTPEQLIAWCAGNDLNCFMYTRAQPGLSATTDQCIIAGRPLLTLTNDTFRHIHRYIPPYPLMGLREAMVRSPAQVQALQRDWSRDAFRETFHRMLGRFGVLPADSAEPGRLRPAPAQDTLLVLSPAGAAEGTAAGDIRNYAPRVVAALGRSGDRRILHLAAGDPAALAAAMRDNPPTACLLIDPTTDWPWPELRPLLGQTGGPCILLTGDAPLAERELAGIAAPRIILAPRPIVPFHTTAVPLRLPRSVWLVGFGASLTALERVLAQLRRQIADVDIIVELPEADRAALEGRISQLSVWQGQDASFRLSIASLPPDGVGVIGRLAEASLIVLHNDPARTAELEAVACLAMTTERPVVFTRSAPFPSFLGRGSYVEDRTVQAMLARGVAGHIDAYYDFGEWTFAAGIARLLDGSWRSVIPPAAPAQPVLLDSVEFLRIAAIGTGAAVAEPPRPVLPLPDALAVPTGPAATRLRQQGQAAATFLLVGLIEDGVTLPSAFVVALAEAWRARGEPLHLVLWDTAARRLHLVNEALWRDLAVPGRPAPPAAADSPILLEPASCGPRDWLLVPEAFHTTPGAHPLLAMNLILEGRRLGLKSAFVFHDAGVVATRHASPAAVEDQILHMQGLLLADAVLPGSAAAAQDLNDIMAGYERAAFVPLIRTVPLPPPGSWRAPAHWAHYVRNLRAALADMADPARRLDRLYLLIPEDAAEPGCAAALAGLAEALDAQGLALLPTRWDAVAGRLAPATPPKPAGADAPVAIPWAPWVAPGKPGAPPWLLLPWAIDGAAMAAMQQAAQAGGLRVAALLTPQRASARATRAPGRAPGARAAELAALARLDKVLAGSRALYDELYRFLLATPERVNSPGDRFGIVELPNDRPGEPRRVAPRRAPPGILQALVLVATRDPAELQALFAAAAQAVRQAPSRLKLTFLATPAVAQSLPEDTIRQAVAGVPGARWEGAVPAARAAALTAQAAFLVHAGPGGEQSEAVGAALWQGVPGLLLEASAAPAAYPGDGLLRADLRNPVAVAAEFLLMLDADRRRTLAREALDRPVRSWRDHAGELVHLLATDRLHEGLPKPAPLSRPDALARFPNLPTRPLLSLCISTYRRAGWVALNLRNIFRQIPTPRADLEVLVVDNASPDNTPEAVQPYLSRPDFRYLRNPRNVGMLGNLAVTAQRARGEYIWILGDDDLTRDGTIERVLSIIQARPGIELIYMNYGYSSEKDPANVTDLPAYLDGFNQLEPPGPDEASSVKLMAAKSENFYTAIYSHVYRRDHGMRAYCQDTSERPFSSMLSCIPTSYYTMHYMPDATAYWIGEPSLVVNSNVSWQAYGTLLDLEQLPAAWDLAERVGCPAAEVDRRRSNRLWLVEMMWREIFEDDRANNAPYFSAPRVLMRLKHLDSFRKHVPVFREIYVKAYDSGHPAATLHPDMLFSFPW